MKILAIETSCDDTGVAVVDVNGREQPCFNVLSNIVSSQAEIHKKWGGVYPTLAKREHQKNLVPTLKKALEKAGLLENPKSKTSNPEQIPVRVGYVGPYDSRQRVWRGEAVVGEQNPKLKILNSILEREPELLKRAFLFLNKYQKPKIDMITVTIGPGLEPCLWQGVNFAKALSFYWNLPIIPVNHIEGHILANWLCAYQQLCAYLVGTQPVPIRQARNLFPAIALVVSGGHTQIILMKKIGAYEILGETRDDAAGECFDKTAKILDIGYPGGPAIANLANKVLPRTRPRSDLGKTARGLTSGALPRPMINTKNYDFSFSGLKTAVLYNFRSQPDSVKKDKKYLIEMSCEIQQAIIDVLIKKTIKAARDCNAETIIIGGGVAAIKELRKQFQRKIKKENLNFQLLIPRPELCSDNGAMIGAAGYFEQMRGTTKDWRKIKAEANLKVD